MKIKDLINNCNICGNLPKLIDTPIQNGTTPFVIIGESPAKDGWIQSKRAFYNSSGKLQATCKVLEKLLNQIGFSINDIYFTECCNVLCPTEKC